MSCTAPWCSPELDLRRSERTRATMTSEMIRPRAVAAVLALCLVAAWGAHTRIRATTQAAGVAGHGARVFAPVTGRPPQSGMAGGRANVFVPVAGRPPQPGAPWFLTIGDSITFGTTLDAELAGTNISW